MPPGPNRPGDPREVGRGPNRACGRRTSPGRLHRIINRPAAPRARHFRDDDRSPNHRGTHHDHDRPTNHRATYFYDDHHRSPNHRGAHFYDDHHRSPNHRGAHHDG